MRGEHDGGKVELRLYPKSDIELTTPTRGRGIKIIGRTNTATTKYRLMKANIGEKSNIHGARERERRNTSVGKKKHKSGVHGGRGKSKDKKRIGSRSQPLKTGPFCLPSKKGGDEDVPSGRSGLSRVTHRR